MALRIIYFIILYFITGAKKRSFKDGMFNTPAPPPSTIIFERLRVVQGVLAHVVGIIYSKFEHSLSSTPNHPYLWG